ncbi:hypothetical protein DN31_2703 [Vibrio mimicus]|nr:hypothetical protein DN31_2703 [Vibrio mimicus]
MSKVKQLNQHRKDYVYDPKPFRKVNTQSPSKIPWLPFLIGFFFGMVFLLFIYKRHYPTFVHLLNTLP